MYSTCASAFVRKIRKKVLAKEVTNRKADFGDYAAIISKLLLYLIYSTCDADFLTACKMENNPSTTTVARDDDDGPTSYGTFLRVGHVSAIASLVLTASASRFPERSVLPAHSILIMSFLMPVRFLLWSFQQPKQLTKSHYGTSVVISV